MINHKAYPKYKDSGVEWLGGIPEGWKIVRMKYAGSLYSGLSGKSGDDFSKDYKAGFSKFIPFTSIYEDYYLNLQRCQFVKITESEQQHRVQKDDLVFIMTSETPEDSGICSIIRESPTEDTFLNTFSNAFRAKQVSPPFLNYLLKSSFHRQFMIKSGRGFTRINLKKDDLKTIPILIPSKKEQVAIASFLDDKVGKIDEAIAQKEQLIQLLGERKQIIIQNAVTKGLNPNAPMKDSGIEWIGEIPEHWEVKRAKFIFEESDQRSIEGSEELLSVSHMTGVTPRSEKNVNMFLSEDYSGSKLCKKGDLVFNVMWTWMGALGVSSTNGIVSPAYGVFSQLNNTFHPVYLEWLLKSLKYLEYYNKFSTGLHSSRLRFYPHMFLNMCMFFPSITEQQEIVLHVQSQSTKITQATDQAQQSIKTLKEYKATLINSAVTGKIKVPS